MLVEKRFEKIFYISSLFLLASFFVVSKANAAGFGVSVGTGSTTLAMPHENLYYGVTSAANNQGNFLLFEKGAGNTIFKIDHAGNITTNGSLLGANSYWNMSGSNLFASSTSWNVGIGTANPGTYKLYVNGNTNINGSLTATSINGTYNGTISAPNVSSGAFAANTGGGDFSFPANINVTGYINSATGYRHGGSAPVGNYLRGNGTNFVSSAIQAGDVPTLNQNTSGYAGFLISEDNRTVSPSELSAARMKFGFTAYDNNNTGPWADFIHMRSYMDSSGGNDNLLLFNRSGLGARIYQQTYGSATAYSAFKDIVLADNTPAANYVTKYSSVGDNVSVASSQLYDNGTGVGIGTTTLGTNKLTVNGNLKVNGQVTATGITGITVAAPNVSSGAFASNTGGGNFSFPGDVNINGNVYIPDTKTYYGAKFNTNDYSTMTFMSRAWSSVQGANGRAYSFQTHTDGGSGGYEAVAINYGESGNILLKPTGGSGKVGIGTTNPYNKLDVDGKVGARSFSFQHQTSPFGAANERFNTGYLSAGAPGYGLGTYDSNGELKMWIGHATHSNSNILLNPVSGNVGIGTSNPGSYKLNVNGNTNITGTLNVSGAITASGITGITVAAPNVSSGTFANNTGGGNFRFPANVSAVGSFAQDTAGLKIFAPGGASYVNQISSITGAIKIKLPVYRTNTMMRMTVKIYQHSSNKSYTVDLGGYNYQDGSWTNTFANVTGGNGGSLTVRFGNDGTNDIIWIGELASVWTYPQVFVTDFEAGYSNYAPDTWDDNWAVSFATAFNTVATTATSALTWNGINDGTGSGLDADLLDGLSSTGLPYYPVGNNATYAVTSGDGNGLKFWNGSNDYKISMGSGAEYHYGTVSEYSIKTAINSNGGLRGFTWGQNGTTPVASLNVGTGNMKIAGTMTAASFSGTYSGTIGAPNGSTGEVGTNTGGGN